MEVSGCRLCRPVPDSGHHDVCRVYHCGPASEPYEDIYTVGGTLIGVLIIGILNNGLNLMGINSNWQYIVKGAVILLAVYVDFLRNSKMKK